MAFEGASSLPCVTQNLSNSSTYLRCGHARSTNLTAASLISRSFQVHNIIHLSDPVGWSWKHVMEGARIVPYGMLVCK